MTSGDIVEALKNGYKITNEKLLMDYIKLDNQNYLVNEYGKDMIDIYDDIVSHPEDYEILSNE